MIAQRDDMEVVADVTGARVLAAVEKWSPQIVLVVSPALTIDDKGVLSKLATLSKVLLIAKTENTHRSLEAIGVGVRAVLSPESSSDELLQVLHMVIEGDTLVIPVAAQGSIDTSGTPRTSDLALRLVGTLTPREAEVMILVARGSSNADIAAKLSVSAATVRSHVHHLLTKLEVGTRAQAVAVAYETGLVTVLEQGFK
ncbi:MULTISPECIES: response regulator transcription factor [unclassified Streptomyces]|uniref:response regulator transcription factor n=1 Tax=unclassified Streptomyces TaxID=2593676 RepID=UPI001EF29158|nr:MULTISPECIES: response regulator transcription factor [unclassified Streptomyces]